MFTLFILSNCDLKKKLFTLQLCFNDHNCKWGHFEENIQLQFLHMGPFFFFQIMNIPNIICAKEGCNFNF